jgi:hypothetical protein
MAENLGVKGQIRALYSRNFSEKVRKTRKYSKSKNSIQAKGIGTLRTEIPPKNMKSPIIAHRK